MARGIFAMTEVKRMTTKVFNNGSSQAVHFPPEFRFTTDEVFINKIGDTVMLTPKTSLRDATSRGAALLPDDFLSDGRPATMDTKGETG